MMLTGTTSSSLKMARWMMLLTATIAACGGLMIALKLSTPNMPMLETVKVPP
jgi:hypothetical protein